mmetsp:Transcript_6698/g.18602  ORF Transcript_6698/g.18602 Transcript_6698/m.18602 type:complete len:222 (+) Transcript_6698:938-1603(+)
MEHVPVGALNVRPRCPRRRYKLLHVLECVGAVAKVALLLEGPDPVVGVPNGQDGESTVGSYVVLKVVLVLVHAKLSPHRLVDEDARSQHLSYGSRRLQPQVKVGVGQGGGNVAAAVTLSQHVHARLHRVVCATRVERRQVDLGLVDAARPCQGPHVHVPDAHSEHLLEPGLFPWGNLMPLGVRAQLAIPPPRHLCPQVVPVLAHRPDQDEADDGDDGQRRP